ncbi:MAG TPA: amino acid ABC transporter substrate-binding protein [Candidatus Angelobacter sp.]|nr:amino acid ABC transporter substrate-binding protein [Candidatus Angelobacter sp.]
MRDLSLFCAGFRVGFRALRGGIAVALLFSATSVLVPESSRATAAADDTISIGVVLPTTGREGKPGQFQKEGIELAIKKINEAGGVFVKDKGKKLLLKEVFYDDGSDPQKSASLAERAMSSDHVTAVVGGYSTQLGQAESVMADRYQTPWIATGAGATAIFSQGYQYAFGALSPVEVLGATTVEFISKLVDQGKLKRGLRVAMAVENTDHGVDYVGGVKEWIAKHPGYFQLVFSENFELGSTDFSGLLQKVKASKADIYLADAHLQDYITMHRQYLQSGMRHQVVSYGARGPESDARKALGAGTDYVFAGIWWSQRLPYPQVAKFIADYKQFTGREPDSWYAATSHEAIRALAAAIEKAGTTNHAAVRNALHSVELKNSLLPGGVLKFGVNGQAGYPFVIVQNKPGDKVDIVYPKESATGEPIAPRP